MNANPHIIDYLANGLYQLCAVSDMFVTSLENRLHAYNGHFKQEKKLTFNRFLNNVKGANILFDDLRQDIWNETKTAKNYQETQEEDNYIARLYLLYIDRIAGDARAMSELYDFVKSKPSKGVVTDEILETFMLK